MGKRDLKKMHKRTLTLQDGKVKEWLTPEFGPLEWQTYDEVHSRVDLFGSGLINMGLCPHDKCGLFENTRPKWMIAAQACFRTSIQLVTLYSNLGETSLFNSINQVEMNAIICNGHNVEKLLDASDLLPSLKYIIYTDDYIPKKEHKTKIQVLSYPQIEELGKNQEYKPIEPKPTDVALVMYTSGSAGLSKGVCITHQNFCAAIGALSLVLGDLSRDTHLAYLPLAHIFELMLELGVLYLGGSLGFGSPRTLTDLSSRPFGDLKAVKPTLLAGVPRVYDTLRKAAMEKISSAGALTKSLFEYAYNAKLTAIQKGKDTPLWNWLVFNNFKQHLGGRVERCISGGAPLSAETQEWCRIVFGVPIVQGYGLTETVAGATVQDFEDRTINTLSVGAPVPCCMLKLVDVPEMSYLSTDKPQRGEIWIKGANVTSGYYKEEQLTQESYTKDGWFKTGDIGSWNEDGTLKIIDRKKNLIKLSKGEYVALESLESVYSGSPFVAPNGICVYGDSYKAYLVALIIPQESYLKSWAHLHQIDGTFVELCKNPLIIKAVLNSLQEQHDHNKKDKIDEINNLRLYPEEWTPENGLLTAAHKLKRSELFKKYEKDIAEMYEK
jgi:long-chain acyl-CoA synthetase